MFFCWDQTCHLSHYIKNYFSANQTWRLVRRVEIWPPNKVTRWKTALKNYFLISHRHQSKLVEEHRFFFFNQDVKCQSLRQKILFHGKWRQHNLSILNSFKIFFRLNKFDIRKRLTQNQLSDIGVGYPRLVKRQSSGGCRFNPDCRRVTIQEYLTLVPGYGKWNQNRRPPWIQ